jgi:hypothetical protein
MTVELRTEYETLKHRALTVAGRSGDVKARVLALRDIYRDSRGDHAFPLLAMHEMLWAYDFFEVTGTLGDFITHRFVGDVTAQGMRLDMLSEFAEAYRTGCCNAFVDTYTNYYFSRAYGEMPGADRFVRPSLLHALNELQHGIQRKKRLPEERKRELFSLALEFEQAQTLAGEIRLGLDRLTCPFVHGLVRRAVVRLAYFPPQVRFYYRDFSDADERVARGRRAYELATQRGWDKVSDATHGYGIILPGRL